MEKIQNKQAEIDKKIEQYTADIFDNLEEDIKVAITKDDDDTNTKIVNKNLNKAIKDGRYDIESMKQLKDLKSARNDEKKLRSELKTMNEKLERKVEEKAQSLTDDEVHDMLVLKWIKPVTDGIESVANGVLTSFVDDMNNLYKKYQYPLVGLTKKEQDATKAVKNSMSHLTGNAIDMQALKMLMEDI